ncbi:Metallo-dependent phosphatase [Xylona heveae TC161]|uniref:Metallo-dependent phosphatase n=1 Tax=Xylona heveae (strain CBS 132557 / TC161) TaxID=1328760 RepID=A0A165GG33_XYLHT|nr:Metallo-dependent phosphatase [Xylona heveae TC161]KZF22138.1 Metallo-dependent phosphatase [Xylona heveae TC161]
MNPIIHDLPKSRKVRLVCVSDTHNASALTGAFKLPRGDILVHAGDLSNQGSLSELRRAAEWIEKTEFQVKIVIAGNHDITLDQEFYQQYGPYFHNQHPQDSQECIKLFTESQNITYLTHSAATVRVPYLDGTEVKLKVFGSPYSPARGRWAFGYSPEQATALWDEVPLDTDVLVTHTPPKYHCDESRDRGAAGCETLRQTLWRVRPRLAICGHVHEGRGAETIRWDLESPNIKYKEHSTRYWNDPGVGNKQSLLDLSAKGGGPLENDGLTGDLIPSHVDVIRENHTIPTAGHSTLFSNARDLPSRPHPTDDGERLASLEHPKTANESHNNSQITNDTFDADWRTRGLRKTTRGQGGHPLSGRSDMESLAGRLGRKETCVINAAIMATSWPHNLGGGKRYNKPIVVDIDMPVTPIGTEEQRR